MHQTSRGDAEGPVKHVLLAEFDIDQGATLSLQYPSPTGTDEHTLAELMLPDGAHLRSEDWTVFYINQRSQRAGGLAVRGTLSTLANHGGMQLEGKDGGEMMYVLNCVKMKEDKTVRRGAMVKALALCTTLPYIQIYKPVLTLALDEYYANPSASVLEKVFISLNAIPLEGCPQISLSERIILRYSDRKDLFREKFPLELTTDHASFSEKPSVGNEPVGGDSERRPVELFPSADQTSLGVKRSLKGTLDRFSSAGTRRMRRSSRGSMRDMADVSSNRALSRLDTPPQYPISESRRFKISQDSKDSVNGMNESPEDTHFFEMIALFGNTSIPIKIPMSTLPEEVGDYSIIALVKKFSPTVPVLFTPPFHPQLHTSGASTHPIILLMNALLTEKRILFLGHGQSASNVVSFVLALCSLPGHVLRGFTERAFPYSNLAGLDILEATPGYIAGVINPRFEDLPRTWDVLCNTETGQITISKHLEVGHNRASGTSSVSSPTGLNIDGNESAHAASLLMGAQSMSIQDGAGKAESFDNVFMEEVLRAIASHNSEAAIRARFSEYVHRFVRLASRYEEENFSWTKIGFRSKKAKSQELGSGYTFANDGARRSELSSNAARIEGWRGTRSYEYWKQDFSRSRQTSEFQGMDLPYQIARLRYAQSVSNEEATLLYARLAQQVQTQEQVVEFLSHLAPFPDGLGYISLGLFHPNSAVRKSTTQLLETLQRFPVSKSIMRSLSPYQDASYSQMKAEGS